MMNEWWNPEPDRATLFIAQKEMPITSV